MKRSQALRALFDNIGNQEVAENLHEDIVSYSPDSWRGNTMKEKLNIHTTDENIRLLIVSKLSWIKKQ